MKITKAIISISSLSFITMLSSCTIFNATIPSYIYITPFSLTCDLTTQGYNSQKITDAWVYANGEVIGVFEIPALVPILTSGETELVILPGIKDNGISGTGVNYPFYKGYTVTKNLTEGNTDTITPTTTYVTGLNPFIVDRFELGNIFGVGDGSDTGWLAITNPEDVFEGSRSILAVLDENHENFIGTTDDLTLVQPGGALYLELDYKCTIDFQIWLKGNYSGTVSTSINKITVTPKENWNKIYINLSQDIRSFAADSYNIEIHATLPSGTEQGKIYLDNFKIIGQEAP